jgi:hypothetical protein
MLGSSGLDLATSESQIQNVARRRSCPLDRFYGMRGVALTFRAT